MDVLNKPVAFYYNNVQSKGHTYALEETYRALQNANNKSKSNNYLSAIQELVSLLMNDDNAKLKVSADRKDWFFCESKVILFLNGLLWLLAFADDDLSSLEGNRWKLLIKKLQSHQLGENFCEILPTTPLLQQTQTLVDMAFKVQKKFREEYSQLEIADYKIDQMAYLVSNPDALILQHKEDQQPAQALESVTRELSRLTGHVGVLLTGSFASPYKRDLYSDLDIHCICNEIPNDEERNEVLANLNTTPGYRRGAFEYIGLPNADIHLAFVPVQSQARALKKWTEAGDESSFRDWQDENYAVSPYNWITGQIQTDPEGKLSNFREISCHYPDVARNRIINEWGEVWKEYAPLFKASMEKGDLLRAFTALHRCNEAAIRTGLAKCEIYGNPIEPKWIPIEIDNLPSDKAERCSYTLGAFKPEGDLEERFDSVNNLWSRLQE